MQHLKKIEQFLTQVNQYQSAYQNQILVVKYGGNAMVTPSLQDAFAQDIALLAILGFKIVVVHGGGPQIDAALQKMGKQGEFIHGYRVTDESTLQAVEWALSGQAQPQILQLISKHLKAYSTEFSENPLHLLNFQNSIISPKCIGLSGRSHDLIRATKMYASNPEQPSSADNQIDIGWVGRVEGINHEFLESLLNENFIPVIAPIGLDESGQAYNINADLVAAFVARALNAKKLIMMSNIPGVLDADKNRIPYLNHNLVQKYIQEGVISGGMIPKIASSLEAIEHGVKNVHIIDGREPHLLLRQFNDDESQSIGTLISLD